MDRFVSHFTNRLDAKGRVSVPASFRLVLGRDGFDGLYVHPALDQAALDAGGHALLSEIDSLMATLPPCSDARDHLATALMGVSEVLRIDQEGRVQLTESLKIYAAIRDQVTFVGLGRKFQIWEPDLFKARLEGARARLRDLKEDLAAPPKAQTGRNSGLSEGSLA